MKKETFIDIIDSIRSQYDFDKAMSESFSSLLGAEISLHKSSRLTNCLYRLLHSVFPPDADGFCEIQEFCYGLDFGRVEGARITSAEELWDVLNSKNPQDFMEKFYLKQ